MKMTLKKLVTRTLAKIIPRTPVGQYPPDSGKVGERLRRGVGLPVKIWIYMNISIIMHRSSQKRQSISNNYLTPLNMHHM